MAVDGGDSDSSSILHCSDTSGERADNPTHDARFILLSQVALPNPHHPPALSFQNPCDQPIANFVPAQLRRPLFRAILRQRRNLVDSIVGNWLGSFIAKVWPKPFQ